MSFEKSVQKNVREIPRKPFTAERILKAHNYAKYETCRSCFYQNVSKIIRTSILKENLMDVPYFIKEHLVMSDFWENL